MTAATSRTELVALAGLIEDPLGPSQSAGRAHNSAAWVVELPIGVRWSGRPKTYDPTNRADRARVYEQVLREGTEDDVRFYVDVDQLLELWDEVVLPGAVRRSWAEWYRLHRGIEVAC